MFCVVTTSTICFWSLQVVSKLFFCSSCVHLHNKWKILFLFFFVQWMKCKKKVVFLMQYILLFHIIDHFFKNKNPIYLFTNLNFYNLNSIIVKLIIHTELLFIIIIFHNLEWYLLLPRFKPFGKALDVLTITKYDDDNFVHYNYIP